MVDQIHQSEEYGHFALSGIKSAWLSMCQRVRNERLNRFTRRPLRRFIRGWVDSEVWGLKLRLASRGNLSEQRLLFWPDGLDRTERLAICAALGTGGVFVDIGANAGVYSLWVAATLGSQVSVEAFEPDSELCNRLQANLDRNGIDCVRIHQAAIEESDGFGSLVRGAKNLGCNRVVPNAKGNRVVLYRLPTVLRAIERDRIDVLKIDVEGSECAALRPLFEEIPETGWPSLIICELSRNMPDDEVVSLLSAHGYRLDGRTRMNGLFRRPMLAEPRPAGTTLSPSVAVEFAAGH